MSASERCPHANCGCPGAPGHLPYCGSYCTNAAQGESLPGEADVEGACACGHEACQAERPGPVERETVVSTGGR